MAPDAAVHRGTPRPVHSAGTPAAEWDAFLRDAAPPRLWLYTTHTDRPHWKADFRSGDYLLFGKESAGVPPEVCEWVGRTYGDDHLITLPMDAGARSLNLATVVCTGVYEGLRQLAG